jgi:hypothetical protein
MSKDALADLLDDEIPGFNGPVDTAAEDFFDGPAREAAYQAAATELFPDKPRGQMPAKGSRRGPPNSIARPGGRRYDDPPVETK